MNESVVVTRPKVLQVMPQYDLFSFYKPAHVLSHSDGRKIQDVLTWSQHQKSLPDDLSLIHRLDLETSGILCACATNEGLKYWGKQWANQKIKKRYLALVHGKTRTKGVIKRALKDARRGRPLTAETRYRTLLHFDQCSLIEVNIVGGRKHQIRKHLQGIAHPILGDERYASAKQIKIHRAPRLCLHAIQLDLPTPSVSFNHLAPLAKDTIQLFCPLPKDLIEYINTLATPHLMQLQKVQNALRIKN
jgi:23S rRNA-/tRNA-specific pseudouridylate synthase